MTTLELQDIRQRMPEAVLLPPEHPLRQAVVEQVAATDGPLEREWLELVQEDERMRVELARVKPPSPDLHRRLMDIPAQTQPVPRSRTGRWWLVVVVAAVLIIAMAVVLAALIR